MRNRTTLMVIVLVLSIVLVSAVEVQETQSSQKVNRIVSQSFGRTPDFVFKDEVTTGVNVNTIFTQHPSGDKLNVRFNNHGTLNDFNIIVDEQLHRTKYGYEFRLPSDDYVFSLTVFGTRKGNVDKVIGEGDYFAQLGELTISFDDFRVLGFESATYHQGNNLVFEFYGDWSEMGYEVGDLVYLDPTFNYDFGASGGVFAWECSGANEAESNEGGADGTPLYWESPLGSCFVITSEATIKASDDSLRSQTLSFPDDAVWLSHYDISNLTATDKILNITYVWEGSLDDTGVSGAGNNQTIYQHIYNYNNESWEFCNVIQPDELGVDDVESCTRNDDSYLSQVTNYYNSSNMVAVATSIINNDEFPTYFETDYIYLTAIGGIENNTFQEASGNQLNKYLNISFAFENNNSVANATFDGTFLYRPSGTTLDTKTETHISTVENTDYRFTYEPDYMNITVESTIIYESHGTQTRTYENTLELHNSSYTTGSETLTLYVLPTADGIFTTFQVLDVAERPLDDVLITANRSISGSNKEVQRGKTGSAGTVSFFLDPDISHTFVLSATGFNTLTTDFAPTQSLYTFTLGSSGGVSINQTNYFQGIEYQMIPQYDSLVNDTFYNFSFYVDSDFYELDRVGYRLFNGTGHFLLNNTCIGVVVTGCNVTMNTATNVGVNSTIIMNAFWDVDGNITNVSRTWSVFEVANIAGDASFTNVIADFKQLSKSFGIMERNRDFTKGIISFLIILFGTGGLALRTGQFSPMAIMIYMGAITIFLDVIGLLPEIITVGGMNAITLLVGVLVVITIITFQRTN